MCIWRSDGPTLPAQAIDWSSKFLVRGCGGALIEINATVISSAPVMQIRGMSHYGTNTTGSTDERPTICLDL
jgi:hypothetical protein